MWYLYVRGKHIHGNIKDLSPLIYVFIEADFEHELSKIWGENIGYDKSFKPKHMLLYSRSSSKSLEKLSGDIRMLKNKYSRSDKIKMVDFLSDPTVAYYPKVPKKNKIRNNPLRRNLTFEL